MAHRGRLNVLAHVLDKPYAQILAEFKDPVAARSFRTDLGWMGDVKYHAGARTAAPRGQMYITMPPNPSHLEAVDPVAVGMARAAGTYADQRGAAHFDGAVTLPILIHGDAAFPGQGVVAETLNLSRLPGYSTPAARSTSSRTISSASPPRRTIPTAPATRAAWRADSRFPIVHVNADDPVACLEAARLALGIPRALRSRLPDRSRRLPASRPQRGRRAVVHAADDVQGGRRRIRPCARAGRGRSSRSGTIAAELPDALVKKHISSELEATLRVARSRSRIRTAAADTAAAGTAGTGRDGRAARSAARDQRRAARPPEGFTFHRKLERGLERRRAALADPDERSIDWADGRGAGARARSSPTAFRSA